MGGLVASVVAALPPLPSSSFAPVNVAAVVAVNSPLWALPGKAHGATCHA